MGITFSVVATAIPLPWWSGALDEQLAEVGLNKSPCAQNLFTGAKFSGEDAKEVCRRTEDLRQFADESGNRNDACDGIDY